MPALPRGVNRAAATRSRARGCTKARPIAHQLAALRKREGAADRARSTAPPVTVTPLRMLYASVPPDPLAVGTDGTVIALTSEEDPIDGMIRWTWHWCPCFLR